MTEFSLKKMVEKLVTYFMQLDLPRFAFLCVLLGSMKIVNFNLVIIWVGDRNGLA
jgi:hypothetical protein